MKKFLPFLLLCVFSISFAACGGGDDDDDDCKGGTEETPFTWNGDWNDPEDANYKAQYEGKYNPIEGDWINEDGDVRNIFTKDFKYNLAHYDKDKKIWEYSTWADKYSINNIGFKFDRQGDVIYEYKIVTENGEKYLLKRHQSLQVDWVYRPSGDWIKFKAFSIE